MAIKTYGQQLEETQVAITAILEGAQSYQLNGRMFTKASLNTLNEREKYFSDMVSRYGADAFAGQRQAFTVSRVVPE